MIDIYKYMKRTKAMRQRHLKLKQPCKERGGVQQNYRGALAHLLDTTIPAGYNIHLCHACNNSKCCNPYHMYWGTVTENVADTIASGRAVMPPTKWTAAHRKAHKQGIAEYWKRKRLCTA